MSFLLMALLASGALASDSVRVVKDIDYVEGVDYADGDDPWRRQQNEDIKKALVEEGHCAVDTIQIANRDHTGIWQSLAASDPALDAMLEFMKAQ